MMNQVNSQELLVTPPSDTEVASSLVTQDQNPGCRRMLIFESPKVTKRKRRSLESCRKKRYRYRLNKKTKLLWKQRAEDYFKGVESDKIQEQEDLEQQEKEIQEQRQLKTTEEKRRRKQTVNEYKGINKELCQSSTGTLILPEVDIPESDNKAQGTLTGIQRMEAEQRIRTAEADKVRALTQAQRYRDLAERYRSEQRDTKVNMSRTIETVRQFWRNKILESNTRAGRMVMMANSHKKQELASQR